MKKLLFYSLCLLFIAGTGCNNDDKETEKKSAADSTKIAAEALTTSMKKFFAAAPPSFKPDATIKNVFEYPDLVDKTQSVKFDYSIFKLFIDSLDEVFHTRARETYLVFGAYTAKDVTRYLTTHVTVPPINPNDILNMPCLLLAYKNPNNGEFIYKDFGTICPPPKSCETAFMVPNKRAFVGVREVGFDPAATILNFKTLYDDDAHPIFPLTEMVKFDIEGINYLVDSLDKAKGVKTNDIYFAIGCYTNGDAQRYVATHPNPNHTISIGEIQNRTCLLYAYKDPKVAGFIYEDFGTICPPPKSCETNFFYTR